MAKDYYSILGVPKTATEDEIQKAFRKLSIKYHPDRQSKKSEAEQKEAEEKFKEINEAYQVLKDPAKKRKYDVGGSNPFDDFESMFRSAGFGPDPFMGHTDPFGFGDIFGERRRRRPKKDFDMPNPADMNGTDIRMNIPLSIEDIINGTTKKVKYKRQVRCHSCYGKGGTGKVECPYCHGTGYITEQTQRGNMTIMQEHNCIHCNGRGYKITNPCPTCGGTGFETIEEILTIGFPGGVIQGEAVSYLTKGNDSKEDGGVPGRFIAIPYYNFDSDSTKYQIKGNDICMNVYVNYEECLLGKVIDLAVPGQSPRSYTLPEGTQDGYSIMVPALGLGYRDMMERQLRGNFYFIIKYKIPKKLSQEEKQLLQQISNLKEKRGL